MTRIRSHYMLSCITFLLLFGSVLMIHAQDNGRGRHKQIYATPTPGAVVIDGNLDDWDLSGQIEMFVVEPTRETMNAKFALMYDADALYISGDVRDPSPLMNRNDPAANPGKGWNADSCQFRLVVDPDATYPEQESVWPYRAAITAGKPLTDTRDDILHMTLWHYTDTKTPAMTIQKGMTYRSLREGWHQGLVPAQEYTAAYVAHADGRGYYFEYRLQWALLGSKRPLAGGDIVAGSVQFNWSTPDGFTSAGGSAWSYDVMREAGFPFQSAQCWGRVIFSETGNVPEILVLAGVPRDRPLPLEFTYQLPADGQTTLQLEKEDGTVVRILVPQQERLGGINIERWDGCDDIGDILPAGTYRWRGITFKEPLRVQYRFSAHNSGQPPYETDDGKGSWGGDHGTPQDVATYGDHVLMIWSAAEYGSGTIHTTVEGRKEWGRQSGGTFLATDGQRYYTAGDHGFHRGAGVAIYDVTNGRPTTLSDGRTESFPPPPGGDDQANDPSGLAYGHEMLYVAYAARNLVALYSTKDGRLLTTWNIPSPQRLTVLPDGRLAVSSGNRVLAVKDGTATPWLTTHLDDPQGMTASSDGTVYVANRGALQNVSVFHADGRYLRSLGKPGGRPSHGLYDAAGMLDAGGIALDSKGRLWVAETSNAPKRISVWDTRTGENLQEFFGGSGYMAYGIIDPARPHELYGEGVIWEIDWQRYTTKPKFTIWRKTAPNLSPAADYGPSRLLTAADGQQYLWGHYRIGNTIHSVMMRRDGDLFKPFMAIFATMGADATGIALLDDDHLTYPRQYERLPAHITPSYCWQDANDDQTVQPEELTLLPGGEHPAYQRPSFSWIDRDLTVRFTTAHLWRPVGVNAQGAPVYDPLHPEKAPAYGSSRYVTGLDDGSVITLNFINLQRGDRGPSLVRWSADGTPLWSYPNMRGWQQSLNLPIVKAGRFWGMTGTMGRAGDFFAHQTYFGPNQLFRTDGMYVGALLQDGRTGGRGAYEGMPEGQFGGFVKLNINDKDRYFTIGAGGDIRVWEVHGLDGIENLPGGVYIHTQEQVNDARAAKAAYEASLTGEREVRILAGGKPALDNAPAAVRSIEGGRGFEVRMSYDTTSLYIKYDVTAPYELSNALVDPRIIYRGGNLLDIQLAVDPAADPQRKTPAIGDTRLLVTRQQGKPYAVLFQPKIAGGTGNPIVLTSPTGQESFDRITVVDTLELEYTKTTTGFTATVTIPQQLVGLQLRPGQKLALDLGYIFGNDGGTRTAMRAYLFNNSFTANVVDDIPHESRLEPAAWGSATVE